MQATCFDPAELAELKRRLAAVPDAASLSPVGIREIVVADDAVERLPPLLRRYGAGERSIVVRDCTPKRRGDEDFHAVLDGVLANGGYDVSTYTLTPAADGDVHADLAQVDRVRRAIVESGADVLAAGSGSVADVCKEACRLAEADTGRRPFLALVPTASSVTAFGSSLAVLLKDGAKRSFRGRFPDVVACDLPTLASAPAAMTRAGFADCCARFVSYGDWYLAHELGFETRYSETPLALMGEDLDQLYLDQAASITAPAGAPFLAKQVLLAGLAQSVVNLSAPLSGLEHVVSHLLDMGASRWRRRHALHGAQVGVATVIAAAAYDRLFEVELPPVAPEPPGETELRGRFEAAFRPLDPSGAMLDEVWRDYMRKLDHWGSADGQRRYRHLVHRWPDVCAELRRLVRPAAFVRRVLADAGAPLRFEDLEPPIPRAQYRFALLHAHLIRSRFTVADLFFWLGRWDAAFVDDLVASAYAASSS